jgi:hypothetical protein
MVDGTMFFLLGLMDGMGHEPDIATHTKMEKMAAGTGLFRRHR